MNGGQGLVAIAITSELKPLASDNAVEFASDEGVVFRYRGLRVWDARGRHLTSRLELRGRELRLIVDDRHAEYPVTIDPTWTKQQKVSATGAIAFGPSVAVSGDTAVVGALGTTVNNQPAPGALYVFNETGGVWKQSQELHGALTTPDQNSFGNGMALEGNTGLIGGFSQGDEGAVYVYVK